MEALDSDIAVSASWTLPAAINRWRMKTELFALPTMARSITMLISVQSSRQRDTFIKHTVTLRPSCTSTRNMAQDVLIICAECLPLLFGIGVAESCLSPAIAWV